MRRARGFTLVELTVVLAIVGFLMASAMYVLSAQVDQRNFEETRRRLEQAREFLLAYAIVNGRLPCPAVAGSSVESIAAAAGTGTGGTCALNYNGFLPAATIGFSAVDAQGRAVDAWGNALRYAVSSTSAPHFTANVTLKANWSTVAPADIDICNHLAAANQASCGAAANRVVTSGTVVAVIWSQGKNFATTAGAASIDEDSNNDAFAAFVSRTPSPPGAANGEFDDMLVWIPVGLLYGRMIAGGVLP
jgi:prepilin-type N-terminal cleavage/methylation domain-containing protein